MVLSEKTEKTQIRSVFGLNILNTNTSQLHGCQKVHMPAEVRRVFEIRVLAPPRRVFFSSGIGDPTAHRNQGNFYGEVLG